MNTEQFELDFESQKKISSLGGNGILTKSDLPSLSAAAKMVEALMSDGQWHSATEIISISGQREGLRRMRELRQRGITVERMRHNDSREFLYRIKP